MNAPQHTRYNIDTCALLVEFTTSVWTARKLDKRTTDELVNNKNAKAKDAARVNKHLLAGRKELEVIIQHVNTVRNRFVNPRTLPWSDSGLRLLPSIGFLEFNARMQAEETIYWALVDEFIKVYPTLITAQAMALGGMFNRDEYPSVDTLKQKFAFSVNYIPVPTSGDFRIDVGNAATQELQDKFNEFSAKRVGVAMDEVKARLKEHLERMSDRLTVDQVGGENVARTFHKSMLDTGWELCDLVKGLNLVGDPGIEEARHKLEQALSGVDVKELRENHAVRHDVKTQVDDILKSMSW